jgi:hypothetical protein
VLHPQPGSIGQGFVRARPALALTLLLLLLASLVPATRPLPVHFGEALPRDSAPPQEAAAPLPGALLGRPELVELREEFARHYALGDGRYLAVVSPTPLNYRDARGRWQPIDARFSPADGGFELKHNSLRGFLGARSSVLHLESGPGEGVSMAWRPLALEASGVEGRRPEQLAVPLPPLETTPPVLEQNRALLRYGRAWSAPQVVERFRAMPGGIKQELLIAAMPQAPVGAEWLELRAALSFPAGTLVFADGAQQTGDFATSGPLELRSAAGALLLALDPPLAYEQDRPEQAVLGRYQVERAPSGLTLRVQTPWSWWKAPVRRYPAVLDPTMHVVKDAENATIVRRRPYEGVVDGDPIGPEILPFAVNQSRTCVGNYVSFINDDDVERGYRRGYVRFELPSLPNNATASAAYFVAAPEQTDSDPTYKYYGDRITRQPTYLLRNSADWRDELLPPAPPTVNTYPAPDPPANAARLKLLKKPDPALAKGGLPQPATIWDVSGDVQGWYADPASNFGFQMRLFYEGFSQFESSLPNVVPGPGEPATVHPSNACFPASANWSLDNVVANLATPQSATVEAPGLGLLIVYTAPQLPVEDMLEGEVVPSALPLETFRYQYHEYALPNAQSGVSWKLVAAAGRTPLSDGISPYTPLTLVTPEGETRTSSDAGEASAFNAQFEHQPNFIAVNAGQGPLNLRVEVDNGPTDVHDDKLYVLQTADVVPAPELLSTADPNKLQATVPISVFRELARGRELNLPAGSTVEIRVPYAGVTDVGTPFSQSLAGLFELQLFAPGLPYGSRSDGAGARLMPGPDAYEIEFPVPEGTSGPFMLVLHANRERGSGTLPATITTCNNSPDVVRYPLEGECVELRRPPASVTDAVQGNEPADSYREFGAGASRVRIFSPAGFAGNCNAACTTNPTLAGVPVMPMIGYGDDGNRWVALKSGQVSVNAGAVATTPNARLLLVDFSDPNLIESLPVLRGQFAMNAAAGRLATTSAPADTYLLIGSPLHAQDDNGGEGNKNGWSYAIDFTGDRLVADGPLQRLLQPSVGGGTTTMSFDARWSVAAEGGPTLEGAIPDLNSIAPSASFDVGSLFVTAPGDGNYGLERGPSAPGALPAAMPAFRHIRMSGATLAQGDAVGGAQLPVQAVILPPGKQVKDEQGFQPSLQCGDVCFDLRGPTDALSAGGELVDRQYRMPDMIIQENAGTVMLQDAGGLSVFSKDHPRARQAGTQEENSTSFSYETFEAEVKTFKGECPPLIDPLTGDKIGSPETTTVVTGRATMSMPNANSEGASGGGGAKIEVFFTLCGGALRDMGFTFDTGDQTAIPIGSSGLFMHLIGGQISLRPEAPGSPVIIVIKIKLRGMNQAVDGSTIFIAGKVTIDTRGLFDLQVHAGVTVSGVGLGVDGHFWVAWAPLDIGFEVQACVPKSVDTANLSFDTTICDDSELLFGSLKLHLWQGQGWQNQYSWLPDDDAIHFTASFQARIKISAGMIVDSGLLVLPPGDLELLGIKLAFGEFCVNAACTSYEWGILATFTVLGFEVGGYYGFDTGLSFFTGSGDYTLIDEFEGQAARARLPGARQAAQETISIAAGSPSALFALAWSTGELTPAFSVKEPGPGGRTLTSASAFADVTVTTTPAAQSNQILIVVRDPKAGDWVVDIVPQGASTPYQFFATRSRPAIKLALAPLGIDQAFAPTTTVPISWTASNLPPSGAWVSLYYSRTLSRQVSGTLVVNQPIVGPIVEHLPLAAAGSYNWNISGLAEGTYQVFARVETNAAQLIEGCGNQPYNPDIRNQGPCDTLLNAAFVIPPKAPEILAPNTLTYRDFTPPAPPAGIAARAEGLSSLAVSWLPNQERDLSGYVVTCEQGALTRRVRVAATVAGSSSLSETARVNGLGGGQAASCSVRAYDYSDNLSEPSAAAQATPSANVPAPPAQVPQVSINPNFDLLANKVKLVWPASPGAKGYLIYYAPIFSPTGGLAAREAQPLQIGGLTLRTGSFQASEGRSPLDAGAPTEATLSGLRPGSTYQVQVRPYDAEGRLGPISLPARFVAPQAPRVLRLPLIGR